MDKIRNDEVLITGSSGFIGSVLAQQIPGAYLLDIKEGDDLLNCYLPKGIKVIFHLAAQSSVEESWNDPYKDSFNFNMTVRLSKAYPNARIIFAQSAAATDIKSPYGFSKRISGDYLERFHKDYVICTFPNVFGPGGKGVVDLFKGKEEVTIYGDGEQIRDFVHVNDITRGLVFAIKWKKGTYFLGSGVGTKVIDLAKGKRIIWQPYRKEVRESILRNTTPDWTPLISVKDYLCQK